MIKKNIFILTIVLFLVFGITISTHCYAQGYLPTLPPDPYQVLLNPSLYPNPIVIGVNNLLANPYPLYTLFGNSPNAATILSASSLVPFASVSPSRNADTLVLPGPLAPYPGAYRTELPYGIAAQLFGVPPSLVALINNYY